MTTAIAIASTQTTRTRPDFAAACEAHLDAVYGYLLHLVRNREVAEDLTSETFERALRAWAAFDERRGTAAAWLVRIARNCALDHFRSEGRRRAREERAAVPERVEAPAAPSGLSPALREALGALSDAEREIVALRVVLEFDTRQAAEILGVSTTTCTTQLHRAMTKLRKEVSDRELR